MASGPNTMNEQVKLRKNKCNLISIANAILTMIQKKLPLKVEQRFPMIG